jgi:hypothetical protein
MFPSPTCPFAGHAGFRQNNVSGFIGLSPLLGRLGNFANEPVFYPILCTFTIKGGATSDFSIRNLPLTQASTESNSVDHDFLSW